MSLVPLIICSYFVATTIARPDVSLGYRYDKGWDGYSYEAPNKHYIPANFLRNDAGSDFLQSGAYDRSGSSVVQLASNSIQTGFQGGAQTVTQGVSGSTSSSSSATSTGQSGGISSSSSASSQSNFQPIVTKNFYVFTAQEEPKEMALARQIQLGRPMKNYRIIFINAPNYVPKSAPIEPIYPKNEEQTIIYVLSKKPDDDVPPEIAEPPVQPTSKPEVRFIKYKTIDEARDYQNKIQAEYDAIQGSSKSLDEVIKPVLSIISNNEASNAVSGSATVVGATSSSTGTGQSVVTGSTSSGSTSLSSSGTTGIVTGQISEGSMGSFTSQGTGDAHTKTPARNYLPPRPY